MASIIDTDRFRGREVASQGTGGDGGGTVDDTQRRLGNLESMVQQIGGDVRETRAILPHLATKADLAEVQADVREIKAVLPQFATKAELAEVQADVREIKSVLPHLATKTELAEVQADVRAIKAELPHLATKAQLEALGARLNSVEGSLRADTQALRSELNARDTRNLTWLIGTIIAVATLTFSIAKFVN